MFGYHGVLLCLRKRETLTWVSAWVNLEDIVLDESSHERTNNFT